MSIILPEKLFKDQGRIGISLVNVLLSLIGMFAFENYGAIRSLAFLSFVVFLLLVVSRLNNILFLARTLFLGVIGYYPMLIKVLAGPDALFSLYEPSTQGFDIVTVMYVATSFALFGNEIGLHLGADERPGKLPVALMPKEEIWATVFYASIPLILLVSYITVQSAPSIFDTAYATEKTTQFLGNTQAVGIICLLSMFVASYKAKIKYSRGIIVVLATIFLVWGLLLRGWRQDILTAILGFVVCYGLVKAKAYSISLRNLGIVFGIIIFMEFMGVVRFRFASEGLAGISSMWDMFIQTLFVKKDAYQFGTISPIATTFSNSVYLIDSNSMDLLLGKSFWEFIPRTPPEFLYPDRPTDYAWIFQTYGLGAGGGIFELAEAYLNFGLIGAFIVPFLISYLLAKSFYATLNKQSVVSYFLLFSFLGVFLRGTWYQIFAFYKSFLTSIILLLFFGFIHFMLRGYVMKSPLHSREP